MIVSQRSSPATADFWVIVSSIEPSGVIVASSPPRLPESSVSYCPSSPAAPIRSPETTPCGASVSSCSAVTSVM